MQVSSSPRLPALALPLARCLRYVIDLADNAVRSAAKIGDSTAAGGLADPEDHQAAAARPVCLDPSGNRTFAKRFIFDNGPMVTPDGPHTLP